LSDSSVTTASQNLRGAPDVRTGRLAQHCAVPDCAQKVALQLNGDETGRIIRKVHDRAVTTQRVGDAYERAAVKIAM